MRSHTPDERQAAPLDAVDDLHDEDVPERELRALLRILAAVAGAHRLDDVLAVAAEEARIALGSSTVSISRWDREAGTLQTLVNVGDLAPGEERWPAAEIYRLDEFRRAFVLLAEGRAHVTDIDDPEADPEECRLLRALLKRSSMAVPIVSDGETWGELYATLAPADGRRFGDRDLRFLSAVSGQVAVAISRAEVFSRMARFAFEDPLTELPNRRALEERMAVAMETALREDGDVALVLCDLDGLKQTNDLLGHEAGDRRLVLMAEALRATAAGRAGALPARIGGDEFCLLLEGAGAQEGQRVAEEINVRLGASGPSPVTVSSGVAALRLGPRSATELFRLADAAQYRAKRMGPGRVCVAGHELPLAAVGQTVRRQVRGADLDPFERLLAETVELLDTTLSGTPPLERIAAVADACARTAGAESWALSSVRAGTDVLETVLSAEPDHLGGRATRRFWLPGDAYPLADYPATKAVLRDGGVLLASVDDPLTDPAERALMVEGGWEHLLAIAVKGPQTTTLVELFADAATLPLPRLAPFARALLAQAAQA